MSYRLGKFSDFHWEFKPVSSYSKNEKQHLLSLHRPHRILKKNDGKVKGSLSKKEGRKREQILFVCKNYYRSVAEEPSLKIKNSTVNIKLYHSVHF